MPVWLGSPNGGGARSSKWRRRNYRRGLISQKRLSSKGAKGMSLPNPTTGAHTAAAAAPAADDEKAQPPFESRVTLPTRRSGHGCPPRPGRRTHWAASGRRQSAKNARPLGEPCMACSWEDNGPVVARRSAMGIHGKAGALQGVKTGQV